MKHIKRINETEEYQGEIIEVTDPTSTSGVKRKVYRTMDIAESKLDLLPQLKGNDFDVVLNICYNTADHEVEKIREKYKNDKTLSDFQKNVMKQAFNWDDGKVMRDPANKRAQNLMMNLEMLRDPDNAEQIKQDYESITPEDIEGLTNIIQKHIDEQDPIGALQRKQPTIDYNSKSDVAKLIDKYIDERKFDEIEKLKKMPELKWYWDQIGESRRILGFRRFFENKFTN
jgi:hypothetical protein